MSTNTETATPNVRTPPQRRQNTNIPRYRPDQQQARAQQQQQARAQPQQHQNQSIRFETATGTRFRPHFSNAELDLLKTVISSINACHADTVGLMQTLLDNNRAITTEIVNLDGAHPFHQNAFHLLNLSHAANLQDYMRNERVANDILVYLRQVISMVYGLNVPQFPSYQQAPQQPASPLWQTSNIIPEYVSLPTQPLQQNHDVWQAFNNMPQQPITFREVNGQNNTFSGIQLPNNMNAMNAMNANNNVADELLTYVTQLFNQQTAPAVAYPTPEQARTATRQCLFCEVENPISTTCPITQNDFTPETLVCQIRGCRHVFETDALANWFSRNSHCPVCRYDIRTYVAAAAAAPAPVTPRPTPEDSDSDSNLDDDDDSSTISTPEPRQMPPTPHASRNPGELMEEGEMTFMVINDGNGTGNRVVPLTHQSTPYPLYATRAPVMHAPASAQGTPAMRAPLLLPNAIQQTGPSTFMYNYIPPAPSGSGSQTPQTPAAGLTREQRATNLIDNTIESTINQLLANPAFQNLSGTGSNVPIRLNTIIRDRNGNVVETNVTETNSATVQNWNRRGASGA